MAGPEGRLVQRASDLSWDLEAGLATSLDEILAEDYHLMRLLRSERDRWQNEQSKKSNA